MRYKTVILFILVLWGCQAPSSQRLIKVTQEKPLMGTYVRLDICTTAQDRNQAEVAFQKAWERLERIAWQMNVYDEKSDVTLINNAGQKIVGIRPDTYFVLQNAVMFWKLTDKTFDITVWPLVQLWRTAADDNQMPSEEALSAVQERVGLGHLKLLGNNKVQFDQEGVQIDLGGIAKGYAIDEVARIFRQEHLRQFYIDAGGDVYAGGLNCEEKPWRIGIAHPKNQDQMVTILNIEDKAVATSGNYAQYIDIQGKQFSHIINPVTGYPQEKVSSATVVADSAQAADALATALTVLGGEKGTILVNESEASYESLILTDQGSSEFIESRSRGFKKFESK